MAAETIHDTPIYYKEGRLICIQNIHYNKILQYSTMTLIFKMFEITENTTRIMEITAQQTFHLNL